MIGALPLPVVVIAFSIVGAIIGSFIGASVLRVPRGEGVVGGRSHCDHCNHVLRAIDLVPLVSYAWLRGRCRHCQVSIAVDQPLAELGGLIVGLIAALSAPTLADGALLALSGWTLVALALLDVRHFWLPDALTLPLILSGFAAAAVMPEISFTDRLVGATCGYGLIEALRFGYRRTSGRDGLGAGDAKLFAAIGAWLGLACLPWVLVLAASSGLAIVGYRACRGKPYSRHDRLPLGTLLCMAAILLMPMGVSTIF